MFEQRRLHPVAALLTFLRLLKETIIPLIFFLFIGPAGDDGRFQIYYYFALAAILIGMLIFGVLSWLRYTYRVEEGELRIEYGVLIRKRRYIPKERIQTIDFTEGLLQRIFGLVKVEVETAGGGARAEAVLTAVTRQEAEDVRTALMTHETANWDTVEESPEESDRVRHRLSWKDLLIAASTSGRIGVVLSATAAFASQFDELIPERFVVGLFEHFFQSGTVVIIVLVLGVLVIAWVLSVIGSVLKYGNFTLTRMDDGDLHITRGLIEKRQLTIPLKRIQAIRMSEGILRQPFGLAALYVESAGGAKEDEGDVSTVLYPLIRMSQVEAFMKEVAPEFAGTIEWKPVPKRARKRYAFRAALPFLILSAILSTVFWPWGTLSIAFIFFGGMYGLLVWHDAAWDRNGDLLLFRYRKISRSTVWMLRKRIQAIDVHQSFFQRQRKLATLQASVISSFSGKQFSITDLDEAECYDSYEWFSPHPANIDSALMGMETVTED